MQHVRNAVQHNLDLRHVATLAYTLPHKYPMKLYDTPTYLQCIRNAADNYDAFSKASGGKIAARKHKRRKACSTSAWALLCGSRRQRTMLAAISSVAT